MSWLWVTAFAVGLYFLCRAYLARIRASLYWVWDDGSDGEHRARVHIDTAPEALNFPKGFLWGVASAAHQIEGGCTNNQWYEWERAAPAAATPNRPRTKHRAGAACNHWQRLKQDTALIKALGVNASRFSVEWSKIEPEKGRFDEKALAHYDEELDLLVASGITPMITLHHFTHPIWFDRLGHFEQRNNLQHWVDFCVKVFDRYQDRCTLWCTFNEPEVFVTGGYFAGNFPPGKRDQAAEAGSVLLNVLEGHVMVYEAIKARAGGARAQVGIVKDVFQMDPYNPLNPLDLVVARVNDSLFNECIFEYFRSGHFSFAAPGVSVKHHNPKAKASNDFVGLNYYSHYLVKGQLNPKQPFVLTHDTRDVMTDMPYPIYAEGLYRAIKRCATLKVPIYITENGLADARDDRRALWINRYLYAVSKAIADGCDVRGFFWWSAFDNFEWAEGYTMRFGLYAVDFDLNDTEKPPRGEPRLRDGAKQFCRIITAHNRKHGVAQPVPPAIADEKRD